MLLLWFFWHIRLYMGLQRLILHTISFRNELSAKEPMAVLFLPGMIMKRYTDTFRDMSSREFDVLYHSIGSFHS